MNEPPPVSGALRGRFDFGATLSRTFGMYFRGWIPVLICVLIVAGPLVGLASWVEYQAYADLLSDGVSLEEGALDGEWTGPVEVDDPMPWLVLLATLLNALGTSFATGVCALLAIRSQRGERLHVGAVLRQFGSRLGPLLGTAVIVTLISLVPLLPLLLNTGWIVPESLDRADAFLGLAFAGLLSLVGLVVVAVFTILAIPAAVLEGRGPLASLKRSIALTRGCRWSIVGLLIIVGLCYGVIEGIVEAVVSESPDADPGVPLALGLELLLSVPLMSLLAGFIYVHARYMHEGAPMEQAEEVFA